MTDPLILCPNCRHELRVPPALLGRSVECPQCMATFTAPAGAAGEPLEVRPAGEEPDGPPAYARALLVISALSLLCLALVGLALNGAALMDVLKDPNGAERRANDFAGNMAAQLKIPPPKVTAQQLRIQSILFVAAGLLTLAGAASMLAGRPYALAVVGPVSALLNVSGCCCLFSLPFSIAALVMLARDDVRATFR